MDTALLHYIYLFDGVALPSSQSEDICCKLAKLIASFAEKMMKEEEDNMSLFKASHFRELSALFTTDLDSIQWFPDFGCVLVENKDDPLQRPDHCSLSLIGLDHFERYVHSGKDKSGKDEFEFTALASKYMEDSIGHVSTSGKDLFYSRFQRIFQKACSRHGDERSAASSGKQGHQKTSAFVKALLVQTLGCHCGDEKCFCELVQPHGGCTDVGLHTGGKARCTEFALVKSVCEWKMRQAYIRDKESDGYEAPSFDMVMMYLDTFILEEALQSVEASILENGVRDDDLVVSSHLWKIWKSLCMKSASLLELGFCLHTRTSKIESLKQKILNITEDWHGNNRDKFQLILPRSNEFCSPPIQIPAGPNSEMRADTVMGEIDLGNIEFIPTFHFHEGWTVSCAYEWAWQSKAIFDASRSTFRVYLCEMEKIFWKLSERYLENPLGDDIQIINLGKLLDLYLECVDAFLLKSTLKEKFRVTYRSIEVLASWLIYCIIFLGLRSLYPNVMLDRFGVALRYQDLSHLVLRKTEHHKVLLKVIHFLTKNFREGSDLFSTRQEQNWNSVTFQMGELYAGEYLCSVYEKEKSNAMARVDAHWKEVERKKELVRNLRLELCELQSEYDALKRKDRMYDNVSRWEMNTAENRVRSKEEDIADAEKAPQAVVQPLPLSREKAMRVLFFLYMPDEFKTLANITFASQQLLVPTPYHDKWGGKDGDERVDVLKIITDPRKKFCWFEHFNEFQHSKYLRIAENRHHDSNYVGISMSSEIPKKNWIGPRHIDSFDTREDGIYYPDNNNIRLTWSGGSLSRRRSVVEFNPFKIPSEITTAYFTARLPSEERCLQWCMYVPPNVDELPQRGNRPYASQNLRPTWLDKEGFLHFAKLRLHATMMLRKLCVILKTESLPLEHECVQDLLFQTVFQIGRIESSDEQCTFAWKKDFDSIRSACIKEIASIINRYVEIPSFHGAFPCLAELFCFFVQIQYNEGHFDHASLDYGSLGQLSTALESWALQCEDEVKKSDPRKISGIRARQVIYFRNAILCLIHKDCLSLEDSSSILYWNIRAKNIFAETKDMLKIRNYLEALCIHELSFNDSYIASLLIDKAQMTLVLRHVIRSAPTTLDWIADKKSKYVFSANGSDGHSYSMNICTGTILIDGLPPSTLPLQITSDERYQRVFGKTIFEIVKKGEWMETAQPVEGRLYRFRTTSDNILFIEESPDINNLAEESIPWIDSLELLHAQDVNIWGNDLPKKLKISYSHWLSREQNLIVFRCVDFRKRLVHFTHDLEDCYKGKQLPGDADISKGSTSVDRIMIHRASHMIDRKPSILDILERVESRDFIHIFYRETSATNSKSIHFDFNLYRLGLTFSINEGDDVIKCLEIVGYKLAQNQHLDGVFPSFSKYLVLEQISDSSIKKIVIPFGKIYRSQDEKRLVGIDALSHDISPVSDHVEKEIHVYRYNIHPRWKNFVSTSIAGRLFLACLFAATNSVIPDKMLGMTGEEQAMILLRECHLNRPLNPLETHSLSNFMDLCRGVSASLLLLSHDLELSTQDFNFLHPSFYNSRLSLHLEVDTLNDAKSAYKSNLDTVSSRLLLTRAESMRLMGELSSASLKKKSHLILPKYDLVEIPSIELTVKQYYAEIEDIRTKQISQAEAKDFPIHFEAKTQIETAVYQDLRQSFELYNERVERKPIEVNMAIRKLETITKSIDDSINKLETYCKETLLGIGHPTSGVCNMSLSNRYRRLCNNLPSVTKRELLKIAYNKDFANAFNPLLSANARKMLHKYILLWLELCVLQDKCALLLLCASDEQRHNEFTKELYSKRSWSVRDHPYWLVFEAEQGIRIRPEQYEIVNHLIHNNGSIVQLNCGLGKTRVILPMLILSFSQNTKLDRIPRIHILNTLLTEFCEYFEIALGASVMNIKLYTMPFRRDVEISGQVINSLENLIHRCKYDRGCFIVAPEHRLSMEMKVKELALENNLDLSERLSNVLNLSRWQNIFDEVDEILHYRYQLIYSIGNVEPLPQMRHRWLAAEALMHILFTNDVEIDGLSVRSRDLHKEACPYIVVEEVSYDLFREKMTDLVFTSPPSFCDWIKGHSRKADMMQVISNPAANPAILEDKLSEDHVCQILAFRGLLALDLLINCLKKRYRVDFGIRKGNKKQLAVPFRGADTPSERSEYSHPDVAIILSIISYYNCGLSLEQFKYSLEAMTKKGKSFQQNTYDCWLQRSLSRIHPETLPSIDKFDKIDLTNKVQLDALYNYFRLNPETINFWLNTFVFPRDLDQYPHRLVGTPWHLAANDSGFAIGFSGTNDLHLVLPLQMKQHLPWNTTDPIWCDILATNGKMLDTIIRKTKKVNLLDDGSPSEVLLQFLLENIDTLHALIDCGALLVGVSCGDIALSIQEHISTNPNKLQGVTFYDDQRREWMVLEKSGRCVPKFQSSFDEKDTFVIFDEPRCRGVDMKLRPDAVAALTIGQDLTKDKFMQAAGRLRKLYDSQSLEIVLEKRLYNEMKVRNFRKESEDIAMLLEWIIQNTVHSVVKGLPIWSEHGIFYETSKKAVHAVLDDKSDLRSFYGKPVKKDDLSNSASLSKKHHFERTGTVATRKVLLNINPILDRCEKLGAGYDIITTATDEECERELQREVEVEEEEEVEISQQHPFSEKDWDYMKIFSCNDVSELSIEAVPYSKMLGENLSIGSEISAIKWPSNLHCTTNFTKTIIVNDGSPVDNYLRIPDCFVQFPSNEVLLLSDREGAKICDIFLDQKNSGFSSNYFFGHFAYESDPNSNKAIRCDLNPVANIPLSSDKVCSMKLFNGETKYPSSQKETMKGLLSINKAVGGIVEAFVNAREKGKNMELSCLEKIFNELALELEEQEY